MHETCCKMSAFRDRNLCLNCRLLRKEILPLVIVVVFEAEIEQNMGTKRSKRERKYVNYNCKGIRSKEETHNRIVISHLA